MPFSHFSDILYLIKTGHPVLLSFYLLVESHRKIPKLLDVREKSSYAGNERLNEEKNHIAKEELYGHLGKETCYDLLEVVMVCLGKEEDK